MQRLAREHVQKVLLEQEMLSVELESKKKKLDAWSRELNKREALTEREKQKLDDEKKQVLNSSMSQSYILIFLFIVIVQRWVYILSAVSPVVEWNSLAAGPLKPTLSN